MSEHLERENPTILIQIDQKFDIKCELFINDTPNTVQNFLDLISKGFYNGLKFYKVIPGFIAQTGCPKGDGTGGPGYHIKCEVSGKNQHHTDGSLSMAHCGRDTGGSQFFICMKEQNVSHLDRNHTVFGRVHKESLPWIDNIQIGDVISTIKVL